MMTVHLRCGSYLLAPVTIDPSRTNTTASSRFQKLISTTKTPLLAFFHDGSIRDQTTCSLMALTHVAEEREQWSKRNATRRCRKLKGSTVGAGLNRVVHPTLTHHGPHLFAVFNAADGTIDKKAKKPKAHAAPIRSHQPLPTRSQYPAARSSRPVRRPATAHDAEKVNAASDASPAKASAGIFEEKKRH